VDYGRYEGLLNVEILKERPGWRLFRDGCPGGETPGQVAARADRVVKRCSSPAHKQKISGNLHRCGVPRFSRAYECVGEAKFVTLWQNKDGAWKVTRAISYNHESLTK